MKKKILVLYFLELLIIKISYVNSWFEKFDILNNKNDCLYIFF